MSARARIPVTGPASPAWRVVRACACALLLLTAAPWALARAAEPGRAVSDLELRSVYLFNFVRFTDWPAQAFTDAGSPITIAVLGEPEFASKLASLLDHKQVGGRTLVVIPASDPGDCATSQVVYVGAGQEKRLGQLVPALAHRPIMTVSSIPSFLRQGGMIRLVQTDEHMQFEINQRATRDAGLKVSARLLQLAQVVVGRS